MRTLRLSLVGTVLLALPGPIIRAHLDSPRPDTSTTMLAMD